MHRNAYINALIEIVGLSDVVSIYDSAIQINPHVQRPDGSYWDGYSVLDVLLNVTPQQRQAAQQHADPEFR